MTLLTALHPPTLARLRLFSHTASIRTSKSSVPRDMRHYNVVVLGGECIEYFVRQ